MDRESAKDPGQLVLFDEPPPADAARTRHALLGGRAVEYRFERRRRRTIGIRISEHGLSVAAPLHAPWREIEGFLHEKARWILDKLDQRAAAGRPRPLFGESGETLPLQGREVVLVVSQAKRAVTLNGTELHICTPEPHRRGTVRELLVGWLKDQALQALAPRAAHYAARVSLPAPPLALSNARTQWGVCMSTGRIRLSWRLVHLDPELADYVIAHEVAHLVELNHSARFWALVEWLYPHWREARERIERDAASIPKI
ncbi:MAG TPA: SprT family zinc-dependent metalloprotease [Burkholderiales bacterium]|nr:SprT family zinc-dependent metalloprotease [Burkholderiales bacterium]